MRGIFDDLVVVISRGEVNAKNTEGPLRVLRPLLESVESIRAFRERVSVVWDGYDTDKRELWEIVEVRDFVRELDDTFPFWLYFLKRTDGGLLAITKCFLLPYIRPEAEQQVNGPRLAGLLQNRWFPALNHIAATIRLDERELQQLSESAMDYLTEGPAKR